MQQFSIKIHSTKFDKFFLLQKSLEEILILSITLSECGTEVQGGGTSRDYCSRTKWIKLVLISSMPCLLLNAKKNLESCSSEWFIIFILHNFYIISIIHENRFIKQCYEF